MQELGRECYLMTMQMGFVPIIIVNIVLCIELTKHLPGMYQWTLLIIQLIEAVVKFKIMTTFISIVPNNNRRVIAIMCYHFLRENRTHLCIVCFVPAA